MRIWLLLLMVSGGLPSAAQQTVAVSASHLDFGTTYPPSSNQELTLTVTSTGSAPVPFTVSNPIPFYWYTIRVSSDRTPAVVTVTAFQTPASLQMYWGLLTITPAQGDAVFVPVTWEYSWPVNDSRLALSPTSVQLTYTAGGIVPSAKVNLTDALGELNGSFSANSVSDGNWLVFSGSEYGFSGSLPSSVTVVCKCNGLSPGTYTGHLNFLMHGQTPPPEYGAIFSQATVAVTLTVKAAASTVLKPAPGNLSFAYDVGGAIPTAQSLTVSTDTGPAATFQAAATTQSGNWLKISPTSATTPATLSVSVNPVGLAPGSYAGNVTLTPSSGTAVSVSISLTVRAAPQISLSASNLAFSYRLGDAAPAAQTVQVSGGGASPTFTVQVSSASPWLSASPPGGTSPATVTVSVDASKLKPGSYSANLTVTGTGTAAGSVPLAVALNVTAALPTISRVVNAASYAEGSIAPGEIVTLFGTNMGPDTLAGLALDSSGKVATSLAGVQVLFDGIAAPLIYASASQISAVAPYELAGRRDTNVQVSWNGQTSNGVTSQLATTSPGVFTANSSGQGPGAIANSDASVNSPGNPAARGDTVVVYVTGEGQTAPAGVTGKVTSVSPTPPLTPQPLLLVSVLLGGQPAQFTFAGEAPGFVSGVMQMNVQIPAEAATGELPIVVSVGGNTSQSGVTVSVK